MFVDVQHIIQIAKNASINLSLAQGRLREKKIFFLSRHFPLLFIEDDQFSPIKLKNNVL